VDGLLHISEIGKGQRLHHAKEAMKVGERVDVVVQAVDRDSRRISLALEGSKNAVEAPGSVPSLASVNAGARLGTFADLLNKAAQKKK
jgi:small subunit ribosomal protein S1